MKTLTMADVIRINGDKGQHFFSSDTMKFFNSKIESKLLDGRLFITSEKKCFNDYTRVYSVRRFKLKNGHIEKVSEFGEFGSKREAINYIKNMKSGKSGN